MRLFEGKLQDLQVRYPHLSDSLQLLSRQIKPKYLDWCARQLERGARTADLVGSLSFFEQNKARFDDKDINSYDFVELEDKIKLLGTSKSAQKSEIKSKGAEKIHEDDEWIVFFIKDKDAAVCYGANTRWCITMKDATYWEQYNDENVLIYYLISKEPEKRKHDDSEKIALAYIRHSNNDISKIEVFNAKDDTITLHTELRRYQMMCSKDAVNRPTNPLVELKMRAQDEGIELDEYLKLDDERKKRFIQYLNRTPGDDRQLTSHDFDPMIEAILQRIEEGDPQDDYGAQLSVGEEAAPSESTLVKNILRKAQISKSEISMFFDVVSAISEAVLDGRQEVEFDDLAAELTSCLKRVHPLLSGQDVISELEFAPQNDEEGYY